jgi:long-chain fatty acid transport protein
MTHFKKIILTTTFLAFGLAGTASATEGYFMNGIGAKSKALAGADIAKADDAMGASLNPAGIIGVDSQISFGISAFNPNRGFTGITVPNTGAFTPDGKIESEAKLFPVPSFGYIRKLSDRSAFALNVYGNGGMNTTYKDALNRNIGMPCAGVFCAGNSGVNLNQLYVAATYATKVGNNLQIGISPIYALQSFEADGLQVFSMYSSAPTKMTNNETDYSHGFGVKIGIQGQIAPDVTLAAVYQPKMNMSEFEEYAGLFADHGDFDIPENYSIGIAVKYSPKTDVMIGYRHISYSQIGAIGNSTSAQLPFGFVGGPGFGWEDVDTLKIGIENKYNEKLTLRGGVSFNNNPVGNEDVTLNILAPGVQTKHFTFGGTLNLSAANSLDFALMYSPKSKVTGNEVTPNGFNPYHTITLEMNQVEATFSFVHKFAK